MTSFYIVGKSDDVAHLQVFGIVVPRLEISD
jgi:hypothetical protein